MARVTQRRVKLVLILLGLQTISHAAKATEGSSAQALFEAGRIAMARSQHASACLKFKESQRLEPAVGTLLNLATCEDKQGHLASAWQRWKEAEDALPAEDERAPYVRAQLDALEARLPRVIYRLTRPPLGVEVQDGGVSLGRPSLGASLPVDPGEHRVDVRAPGHSPIVLSYVIAEGERKTIQLRVGPLLRVEPEPSVLRTTGYWFLGAGAVGLLTAGTTGILAEQTKSTYDKHCTSLGCDSTGESAARRGKTLVLVNAVAWVASIATAVTGGYLLAVAPREESKQTTAWRWVQTDAGVSIQSVF